MTKSDDFQRRNLSSVGRILGKQIFRRPGFSGWGRCRGKGSKHEGDDLTKSDNFQIRNLRSVLPFDIVTTFNEKWPSSSHRKMGGRFGEKCRFSKETIEFGWPFYLKFSAHG